VKDDEAKKQMKHGVLPVTVKSNGPATPSMALYYLCASLHLLCAHDKIM